MFIFSYSPVMFSSQTDPTGKCNNHVIVNCVIAQVKYMASRHMVFEVLTDFLCHWCCLEAVWHTIIVSSGHVYSYALSTTLRGLVIPFMRIKVMYRWRGGDACIFVGVTWITKYLVGWSIYSYWYYYICQRVWWNMLKMKLALLVGDLELNEKSSRPKH